MVVTIDGVERPPMTGSAIVYGLSLSGGVWGFGMELNVLGVSGLLTS